MTDEQALLRRYMQDVTDPSPGTVDSALAALTIAIDEESAPGTIGNANPASRIRRPRLRLVLVAAGVIVVVVAICVPLLTSTSGPRPATSGPVAPKWRLTGDIEQPEWQVKGGLGSQSYELVCPTTTECFVTEPSTPTSAQQAPNGIVETSRDGGQTWTVSLDEPGGDLVGLTCPTATTCVVTGENFGSGNTTVNTYVTTDAGASWSTLSSPGPSLGSGLMSCSSISQCVTTTSQAGPNGIGEQDLAEVTDDGGLHWATYPFPGSFRPYQLQCIGQRCVALGEAPPGYVIRSIEGTHGIAAAAYSADGGRSWSMGALPSADLTNGLSCADAMHCFAIEQTTTSAGSELEGPVTANVIATDDGGETWTPTVGNDPDRWLLGSISCPTVSECWITGVEHAPGETITQAGQTFDTPNAPATFLKVTQDGGQTWTSVSLPSVNGVPITNVGNVTCTDVTSCFALAQDPTGPAGTAQRQLVISTNESS